MSIYSISWEKSCSCDCSHCLLCASYSDESITYIGVVSSTCACSTSYYSYSYCISFSFLPISCSSLSCYFNSCKLLFSLLQLFLLTLPLHDPSVTSLPKSPNLLLTQVDLIWTWNFTSPLHYQWPSSFLFQAQVFFPCCYWWWCSLRCCHHLHC